MTDTPAITSEPEATEPSAPPPTVETLEDQSVVAAFNVASLGDAIIWTSGPPGGDAAPDLWRLDPHSGGRPTLVYRSSSTLATLANPASRGGWYSFVETTAESWRLIIISPDGTRSVLDTFDLAANQASILPAPTFGRDAVYWTVTHSDGSRPTQKQIELDPKTGVRCELRKADLATLVQTTLQSAACSVTEYWFPSADWQRVAFGTVEHGANGSRDDRHVYLLDEARPSSPLLLDSTAEASMPALLGDSVAWKTATPSLNMLADGSLELHSLTSGKTRLYAVRAGQEDRWGPPSIGPHFVASQLQGGSEEDVFDIATGTEMLVDRLPATGDAGFFSDVSLSGDLLAWFFTASVNGGPRQLRWTVLPG